MYEPQTSSADSAHESSLFSLMSQARTMTPSDIRISNRLTFFNLLFSGYNCTRAELGRITGLSKVSASDLVSDLISKHIFSELGVDEESKRGKRGILLDIDKEYWSIITLDLSQPFLIQGAVVNLAGDVLFQQELPLAQIRDVTLDQIVELCSSLINHAQGSVLALGVAVSGIVNTKGVVVHSANLGWENVDLQTTLTEHFNVQTYVIHDTHCAMLAERFFGHKSKNALFIQISAGIGSSVLINDSLVTGVHQTAGEIAHIIVDPQGQLCSCGKHGCLETFLSYPNLQRAILADPEKRTDILVERAHLLGRTLVTPLSLLDIPDVIVSGNSEIVNPVFLTALETEINASVTPKHQESFHVWRCECGTDMMMRGAVIYVIHQLLKDMQS